MMRVRIDGGQLDARRSCGPSPTSPPSTRATPPTSPTGRTSSCTGSAIEDVPDDLGARSRRSACPRTEACGDVPRVILGCPLAGIAADEIIDATPAIHEIHDRYIGNPEFSNLPRKFKTAITGSPGALDVVHEINDVAFVGVVHPEHGTGYDLWVGGGLSTNPMLARALGVFVTLEEVPEVWHGVTAIFRDYGYRRLRTAPG